MINVFVLDKVEVPPVTGERKLVIELAKNLSSLNREVYLYSETNSNAKIEGVKIARSRDFPLFSLKNKKVVYQYQVSSSVFKKTFWAGFLGNSRFIYAFMGGDLNAIFFEKNDYLLRLFEHVVDKVVVLAEYQREFMERLLDVDVVVIPPFVDEQDMKNTCIRRNDGVRLLFMGLPSFNKGLDVLLKAFKILLRDYSNSRLIIADSGGDSIASVEAKEMIHDLNLESQIDYVGVVDALEVMSGVDLFVYPARTINDTMAIPISLLEALSVGTPAVSTDIGGVSEVLSPGYVAIPGDYVSLYEAISRALKDQVPSVPSKFLKKNVLPLYLQLYDSLIQ